MSMTTCCRRRPFLKWGWIPASVLGGVLCVPARADAPSTGAVAAPVASTANDHCCTPAPGAPVTTYTLAELIQLACQRQPAIAAARASLAAAVTGSQGVESLRVPTFLARDLPVRRQQARLGIEAAQAGVATAERETAYAVTRLYYTVQFARAQRRVAQYVVDQLQDSFNNAKLLIGKPGTPRDLTQTAVDRNEAYLGIAKSKLVDAEEGERIALAALGEAVGLSPDCCFTIPADGLPTPTAQTSCAEIVALALQRRGEIIEASTLAQATCLEAEAQSKSCRLQRPTFAAFTDLHAVPVPTGVSNDEYRPGALGPALPVTLAGTRSTRVELAQEYSARSTAVADKTRNLVALEAENTYLRWLEAKRKLPLALNSAKLARKTADTELKDFKALGGHYRDVLESAVVAGQIGAQLNEIRFHYVIELAALERVTAGGFCAGLIPTTILGAAPQTGGVSSGSAGINVNGD